jgi:hypothetical protein
MIIIGPSHETGFWIFNVILLEISKGVIKHINSLLKIHYHTFGIKMNLKILQNVKCGFHKSQGIDIGAGTIRPI